MLHRAQYWNDGDGHILFIADDHEVDGDAYDHDDGADNVLDDMWYPGTFSEEFSVCKKPCPNWVFTN